MRKLSRMRVDGLFGYMTHDIRIRADAPTLLTAPNGAGKTHLLMLLRAALSLDTGSLAALPFEELRIWWSDGRSLQIQRSVDVTGPTELRLNAWRGSASLGVPAIVKDDSAEAESNLPDHIRKLSDGRWYDRRAERILSETMIERRYGVKISPTLHQRFRENPEILEVVAEGRSIMIDTKRLDSATVQGSQLEVERYRLRDNAASASSIDRYIDQIRFEVVDARRQSVGATQSADLSFAARALEAASMSVKESDLHRRYDGIVNTYEDLARNGLAIGEAPMAFPSKTTPTVRRILNVFLDDWEKRLQPLTPVNAKIKTLREILDMKLEASGKRTEVGRDARLAFRSFGGKRIRLASLSSGEQHLIALFTLLLFTARRGSVVLIDEPEISMHAAWKHAFLEDVSRVAAIADLQFVIATHSTAIVNGRWDLTEELQFSVSEHQDGGDDDEEVVDLDTDGALE